MQYTWTLSPTVVNDANAAVYRGFSFGAGTPDADKGASLIGQPHPLGPCLPAVHIPGFYAGGQSELKCWQSEGDTNYRFSDTLTVQRGKHLLRFGGNMIKWAGNFPVVTNGQFTFNAGETGLPGAFLADTGNSYASFLLGGVDNSAVQGGQNQAGRSNVWGFFAQDEWRVNKRLTLTLGLRYDAQPFPLQDHDEISQWLDTLPNPGAGGLLGALGFAGFGKDAAGHSRLGYRRMSPSHYFDRNFAPRVGFAYRLTDNTSVRGNYSVFYGPVTQTMAGFDAVLQQGFYATLTKVSVDGFTAPFNWDAGFPLGTAPLFGNFDPTSANGSNTFYFGKDGGRAPLITMSHFAVQHQLPGKVMVDFVYFGQWTHGLIADGPEERNQLDYRKYAGLGSELTADIGCIGLGTCPKAVAAGLKVPYAGFTGSVSQALRPFPQYLGIENESGAISWATYNSFQFKAQKQFGNGLSLLIGYTISKNLSDLGSTVPGYFAAASQDAYNHRAEKGLSSIDIPQSLIASYTYELPVGKGKRFLNGNDPISQYVVGGWTIAGIHTYNRGTPLSIGTDITLPTMSAGALSAATLRPNLVPGVSMTSASCSSFNPSTDRLLNTAAFAAPAPYSFGNASRSPGPRACGYLNENFSLYKNFPIKERLNLRFGVDTFNLFNRHPWGGPNTDWSSAGFGQIGSASPGRIVQLNARVDF